MFQNLCEPNIFAGKFDAAVTYPVSFLFPLFNVDFTKKPHKINCRVKSFGLLPRIKQTKMA